MSCIGIINQKANLFSFHLGPKGGDCIWKIQIHRHVFSDSLSVVLTVEINGGWSEVSGNHCIAEGIYLA